MSEPAPSSTAATDFSELLGPELASALDKKGYTTLTPVQRAVLDPTLADRDLRISSQTGSGKTLAIGFVLRHAVTPTPLRTLPAARPQALVIVPTRELAKQVTEELGWLYAPLKVRIASVTGGASYRDEHRSLAAAPSIVVGTPGRLLDHLNRGGIEGTDIAAVVLDEADRMLDLGFRDELEAILDKAPPGHRTHLVSATFARDVAALADRVQADPKRIEATPLGTANRDIDHIVYLVNPKERVDALINVLLHHADEQTLVFARTRADVSEIARELQQAGFASGSLSGEMDQNARNRALAAFKRGDMRALIATDVAARGIDVQDIARVIQIDPPTDPDTYTHRSGRTGRAGRKGVSAVLVAPAGLRRAASLLQRARVQYRVEPIPTAAAIRQAQDERWLAELTAEGEREVPERVQAQVQRIVEAGLSERALAQLIINVRRATGEPREVTPLFADAPRQGDRRGARQPEPRGRRGFEPEGGDRRDFRGEPGPRSFEQRPSSPPPSRSDRSFEPRGDRQEQGDGWVPFRVSWGEAHGADARRLVAMLCRRGNIRGGDIGAIKVGRTSSTVEVAAAVAQGFGEATREPDPRDPRVLVSPLHGGPAPRAPRDFEAKAPRDFAPKAPRDFAPKAPRDFAPKAPRDFAPKAPRDFAPKAPRDFAPKAPRDFAPKAPRDFAPKAPRDFAPKAPRDFAPKAPRDFAPKAPRDFAPKKAPRDFAAKGPRDFAPKVPREQVPARDTPPKRPARKIVVTAPPPRAKKRK
jgi:ATP-dependent RNA helicase DeaD